MDSVWGRGRGPYAGPDIGSILARTETMRLNEITTTEDIWGKIKEPLGNCEVEHLVLALLGLCDTEERREFLLFQVYLPEPGEYLAQGPGIVTLKAESAAEVLRRSKGCSGVMDIHNHLGDSPHVGFSSIDHQGIEKEARNVFDFKGDNYLVRIVKNSSQIRAEVTNKQLYPGWEPIDRIKVIGKKGFTFLYPCNSRVEPPDPPVDYEAHRRTLEFYSKDALELISSLHFGVIGAGGTGSAFLNLLKFFARKITIVEEDCVERHNSSRLFHYVSGDDGRLKADIHMRELMRFSPDMEVKVVDSMFPSDEGVEALKSCDFIVVAPDNNLARYKAAEFAGRYMKPLIDFGSGVRMRDGRVTSIGCHVRLQLPTDEGKCLVCNGLDVENLAPPEFDEYKRAIGYLEGANSDETPASVVTINSMAATIGMRLLLDYFGDYTGKALPNHILYDELSMKLVDLSGAFHKHPGCTICGRNDDSVFGRGDFLPEGLRVPQPRGTLMEEEKCQC